VDIGVPQFGMHSIRELCGADDPHALYRLLVACFDGA
jgi:aspartyl aminopeptidase